MDVGVGFKIRLSAKKKKKKKKRYFQIMVLEKTVESPLQGDQTFQLNNSNNSILMNER